MTKPTKTYKSINCDQCEFVGDVRGMASHRKSAHGTPYSFQTGYSWVTIAAMVCAGLYFLPIAQSFVSYIVKGVVVSMFAVGQIRSTLASVSTEFATEKVENLAVNWADGFRSYSCWIVG